MDLAQVIRKSLREAQHQPLDGPTKRVLHSQRSQAWVKALGANLMSSEVLRHPAVHVSGSLYVTLVPHPDRWDAGDSDVSLWRLAGGKWLAMST